jgi:hypothetical protein
MHPYLGDFAAGQTIHLALNTSDLGAAPITLASSTFRVYRDDGDTEDDSGITPDIDSDTRTGFHRVAIDLSADGTFYAAEHDFFVVLTVGTVDSVSVVGKVVAQFSIRNRSAHAVIPNSIAAIGSRPTPDQALLMLVRFWLTHRQFTGSDMECTEEDGLTTSMKFTVDNPSAPTTYDRVTP